MKLWRTHTYSLCISDDMIIIHLSHQFPSLENIVLEKGQDKIGFQKKDWNEFKVIKGEQIANYESEVDNGVAGTWHRSDLNCISNFDEHWDISTDNEGDLYIVHRHSLAMLVIWNSVARVSITYTDIMVDFGDHIDLNDFRGFVKPLPGIRTEIESCKMVTVQ